MVRKILKQPENWQQMAAIIEYADLRVDTRKSDLDLLCLQAEKFNIPTIVVNPNNVRLVREYAKICNINIGVVISYPVGAYDPNAKSSEIEEAISDGADIIYMTMAVGAFLSGWIEKSTKPEIQGLVRTANGRPTRLITEGSILNTKQKYELCHLAIECGIDELFVCTGFIPGKLPPITHEDISIFFDAAGNEINLGYMGDIDNCENAFEMIDLGISHFCTYSALKILSYYPDFPKL